MSNKVKVDARAAAYPEADGLVGAARHPRWYMIKHRGYYYISKGKKR